MLPHLFVGRRSKELDRNLYFLYRLEFGMPSLFSTAASYISKALGLESISAFPAHHAYARTRWDPSYFDIAYGTTPDEIERAICTAITNTPLIFTHILNPTPRMQTALLAVLDESLRRGDGNAPGLMEMLMASYDSPHTQEAVPGLRAAIARAIYEEQGTERARSVLRFLSNTPVPFGVLEAET